VARVFWSDSGLAGGGTTLRCQMCHGLAWGDFGATEDSHGAAQRRTTFLEATAEVGSCQGGSGSELPRPVRSLARVGSASLACWTSTLHVPLLQMSGAVQGPRPVWGPVWGLRSEVERKDWFDSWGSSGFLCLGSVRPLGL